YAIAIILISAMFGDRYTWMALIASLALHLGLGGVRSGLPPTSALEVALPLSALLTGLTLLQRFAAGLLRQALNKTRRDGEELQQLNRELSLINRVISEASASLDEAGILQAACRELADGLEMPFAYAAVFDSSHLQLKFLAEYPAPVRPQLAGREISLQSIPDIGAILQATGPLALPANPSNERLKNFEVWLHNYDFASALALPLFIRRQGLGFIILLSPLERSFSPQEITLAGNAAAWVAQAVDNARMYAELKVQAQRDDLTGLLNRRGLMDLGGREFERARRFGRALAVIFVDADNLKTINDRYGHAVGDLALKFMASQLRRNTREFDLTGRLGGDEFIILLAEADQHLAQEIAERLRRQVNDAPLSVGLEQVPVSVSLGVAHLNGHSSLDELIQLADQAMYQFKQSKRNPPGG
ncbi:MAG: sensor domain-containing diguanylate cyclase, partial [Chloroflexi bacterium]|nr:sensor domain-containing diguanylate cyclase [Chloroflexota bacterium]